MRALVAIVGGMSLMAAVSAWAQDQAGSTTIMKPDETVISPPDSSHLILPGQPDDADPAIPPPTLPPLWLVPLPDEAAQAADRARLDAALAARFAFAPSPVRYFDADIVPLAAGQPWQALRRRVDGTLGP
ncbi:MAG TPA: hypothetical protein VGV37_27015 [Aliidongia sp.]|uniref:hypothetical protein n=1 Tax=Aliidongia sp. TaxID=1914230 RepID=UPI002DDCF1F5|nr:hypothetical protein [Aliidongia sp.]HEV2678208.1 hypothetical protein [Aliidongia sp.]